MLTPLVVIIKHWLYPLCIVQHILVADFIFKSLYLSLYPHLPLSPFSSGNCIRKSASFFVIYPLVHYVFLESTYNWYHTAFAFLISLSTIPSSPWRCFSWQKVHSFFGRILNCQYILKILYHSPVDGHCAGFCYVCNFK